MVTTLPYLPLPQYNDIVMNEQELAPRADSTAVAPNSFGMDLAEGHVV